MRLYPDVHVKGQSFAHVKKVVVPMQSMSLREILRRFVRKESLPVSHEGTYEDRYDYDLEKLAHEDLTVKEELLSEFRQRVKDLDLKVKLEEKTLKEKQREKQEASYQSMLKDLSTKVANATGVKT